MRCGRGALRLVADVGGTNARFSLAGQGRECVTLVNLHVAEFPRFDDALAACLERIAPPRERALIGSAAFAAAGPVDGGDVQLTNAPWRLNADEISARLGGLPVRIFNDLEAVAFALPYLGGQDVTPVGPVSRPSGGAPGRMVAVNVGTGFGAAAAIPADGGWLSCPGEAGHMSLAAADAEEAELLGRVAPGRMATLEDVLSGPGVATLYNMLSGAASPATAAADVFARLPGDGAARRAVELVTRWLGRAAGDLALATAAWSGVFLLGGVVSGWHRHCDETAFRAAFEDKGKMRPRMSGVFSGVIARQDVALLGLARAPVTTWC